MDTKIGNFFTGGDQLPLCDLDFIAGCEREVAEASNGGSEEQMYESVIRLARALVHSIHRAEVVRGIAMLEMSMDNESSPLHLREMLYLLAVGYYRNNDYGVSQQRVEQCLEIAPDWQALSLKKKVEDQIAKDGGIGIGITAAAVGLIVGGIAAALARWN